jgi:two-component system OmpR family sensor kinase/two-component system sensor histidine kinase BaeS
MWRFLLPFGALMILFLISLAVVLGWLFATWQNGRPPFNGPPLIACGLPLLIGLSVILVGGLSFRRIGRPVANLMDAADRVAEGDLSVRVDENLPGEFGRLNQRFNRMTAELERSDRQRKSLTADIAHELRTPLHIIQGNLEGVLDGVYQPTPEHMGATLEETRLLARLVSDLQTLSLAETGQLPLYPVELQAADLLEDVAASFSGTASTSGVTISVEVSQEDLSLRGDPDRLDQVLSNLVANALRFTPAGGTIFLKAARFTEGISLPEGIRFQVQDNGRGIPPEDLPFLFDRFWKGERARTRHEGTGSGLGLAIARQLVLAHGGEIRVESTLGQGTTFIVDLPTVT